ncbi:hypothetical protein GOE03_28375 [Sinorhizobium medicae]|nr:hypothetical protein [Sinorhizobium medicae]
MGLKKRTKTLSSLSRTLLSEGESEHVDFKRSPDGVSADDLVAFANSDSGGHILVGVDEQTVGNTQIGVVRGCDVSDASILQILNKAVSCIPPVSMDVFIENLNAKPILRIAVASSATKPHCTPKGIYCRRDGSRNRPLHPNELLKIFLDTEARAFAERFESAAGRIAEDLSELEDTLDKSIKNMGDQLGWAEYKLGDTESTLDAILGQVGRLGRETDDISSRLRSLFRQDKRDDPVRNREFNKVVDEFVKVISGREDLLRAIAAGGTLTMTAEGKVSRDVTEDDFREALDKAVSVVRKMEDQKKYAVECKSPSRCTEAELDCFGAIVAEGGEIADGIRNRVESAHVLGFVTYEGVIVGAAALKKPKASYHAKVFENAKSRANPKDYPFELGWIFLQTPHQKKGQMTKLLGQLMPLVKGQNMFATTRTGNERMREMLLQMQFRSDGEAYPSAQQPDQTVQLFLRIGNVTKEK